MNQFNHNPSNNSLKNQQFNLKNNIKYVKTDSNELKNNFRINQIDEINNSFYYQRYDSCNNELYYKNNNCMNNNNNSYNFNNDNFINLYPKHNMSNSYETFNNQNTFNSNDVNNNNSIHNDFNILQTNKIKKLHFQNNSCPNNMLFNEYSLKFKSPQSSDCNVDKTSNNLSLDSKMNSNKIVGKNTCKSLFQGKLIENKRNLNEFDTKSNNLNEILSRKNFNLFEFIRTKKGSK